MPTNGGFSAAGLQLVGTLPFVADRFLVIALPSLEPGERLDRVGTALLYEASVAGRYLTVKAYRLYGGGMYVNMDAEVPPVPLEVWVNWFRSGISFTVQTRP